MWIYLVGVSLAAPARLRQSGRIPQIRELISYFELMGGRGKEDQARMVMTSKTNTGHPTIIVPPKWRLELFLDSGAYSAFTKDVAISLDAYVKFVHEHKAFLTTYANLDVIGNPRASWNNQMEMERQGLQPLPCFHYGEPSQYLKLYMDRYEYIALGGMVAIDSLTQIRWLDDQMRMLCDTAGRPLRRFHGFGVTALPLLLRYPWYSVDSTSWILTGRFGGIYLWIHDGPQVIRVSDQSPGQQKLGQHLSTLSGPERRFVLNKIEEWDFVLEGKKGWQERGESGGLADDYVRRDEWNIRFFLELEGRLQGDRRFTPHVRQEGFF